ncbi:MAG: hypothetical protein ABIK09_19955 [Pseudomonadota bacterium]
MRPIRIILPLLVALTLVASCSEQKVAPEAQKQAKQAQQAPQQQLEAARPAAGAVGAEAPPTAKAVGAEAPPTAEVKPVEQVEPPVTRPVPPTDRTITLDRSTPVAQAGQDETPGETFVLPELETIDLPNFDYPDFNGKKFTIVFTGNVIGELEPCG